MAPVDVPWLDAFQRSVYDTLMAARDRFRFCAYTKCRAPFLAKKRQIYHDPKCSQAVRTRKYRLEKREHFRQLRREAYKRKLRAAGVGRVQNYKRRAV